MLRAGALRHLIVVQRAETSVNASGTPTKVWTDRLRLRAERIAPSTEEYLAGGGARDRESVVFRTHWVDGVTTSDRVQFDGRAYNIRALAELGHRVGLELRCESLEA